MQIPSDWIDKEDRECRADRISRMSWLLDNTPTVEFWRLPGGLFNKCLFEEARYSFIYGQFISTSVTGYAFIERALASILFGAGSDDIRRASGEKIISEAIKTGWLTNKEAELCNQARQLRNPLVHFREPLHKNLPEIRALQRNKNPYDVMEDDAKIILEAVFHLIAKQAD